MIKKKLKYLLLLLLIGSLYFAACTQERGPCLLAKKASLIMHTYHFATDTNLIVSDTTLPAAILAAITAPDTIAALFEPASAIFTISLSPVADSCRWLLVPDSSQQYTRPADTLTFHYQRKLQFLSNACGYTYFFNLTAVNTTTHNIDSVTIENTSVTTNVNTEHLKIYIHPDF